MSTRLIAIRIIQTVVEKQIHLSQVLNEDQAFNDAGQSRAWIQEVCYGTLRWYLQLESILGSLLTKPVRKKDRMLHYLLLTGLYQLRYMQDPPHAVVSETVDVCRQLRKDSARGLVNAILRRYIRDSASIEAGLEHELAFATSHPDWLIKRLQRDWPEQFQQILEANNQRPPMTLRLNRLRTDRQQYLQLLRQNNMNAVATQYSADGIHLERPCQVTQLPGFNEGMVSVQDEAAQLAAGLMQLQAGHRVLDACAAPGGKSAHILEIMSDLQQLILVEKEAARAEKIRENMHRLQFSANLKISDLCRLEEWWDGQAFDRILLDAPCSATGVIRRHPDIKLLRTEAQIDNINQLQLQLLDSAWQTLTPSGVLVYATCSVLKQENSDTIKLFLESHQDSVLQAIDNSWGVDTGYGKQILPGMDNMDGFFYAVICKTAASPV